MTSKRDLSGHDPGFSKFLKEMNAPQLQAILADDREARVNRASARKNGHKNTTEARNEAFDKFAKLCRFRDAHCSKWLDDTLKANVWGWLYRLGKKYNKIPWRLGVRWSILHGSDGLGPDGPDKPFSILRVSIWGKEKASTKIYWRG